MFSCPNKMHVSYNQNHSCGDAAFLPLALCSRVVPSTFWSMWSHVPPPGPTSSSMCWSVCGTTSWTGVGSPERRGPTWRKPGSPRFTCDTLRPQRSLCWSGLILWDMLLNDLKASPLEKDWAPIERKYIYFLQNLQQHRLFFSSTLPTST